MKLETLDCCCICRSKRIESIDPDHHICQCQSCGYIFDNPRPAFDEIARFYSKPNKYESWLAEEKARDALWKRRLKKMGKHGKTGTLLDIGTGIGQFLHHAREQYTRAYGTEISDSAIHVAKEKYHVDVMRGDISTMQFKETSAFDTITLFHVLEHVENPRVVLEKCWSLLSDEGILVIAVPDTLSLKCRIETSLKLFLTKVGINKYENIGHLGLPKIILDGSLTEIHLSHFAPKVLEHLLQNSGFSLLEYSLDPHYVAKGVRLILHHLFYLLSTWLLFAFHINIYGTIWMVAKKRQR